MSVPIQHLRPGDVIGCIAPVADLRIGTEYRVAKTPGGDLYLNTDAGVHILTELVGPDGILHEFEFVEFGADA